MALIGNTLLKKVIRILWSILLLPVAVVAQETTEVEVEPEVIVHQFKESLPVGVLLRKPFYQ
jgi:uncharacterized membrane protein YqaE (UPF0057 family)